MNFILPGRRGWAGTLSPLPLLAALILSGCAGHDAPEEVWIELTIPAGATFGQVTDTLVARDLVGQPRLFRAFARVRGDDRGIRAGRYRVPAGIRWAPLLDRLVEGRVVTDVLTIPEGFTLRQIAPRLARIVEMDPEEAARRLAAEDAVAGWGLPGPSLEGYLFPDTYRFAPGVPLDSVIQVMVDRYHGYWTAERRAALEEMELTEGEAVTLASIVQAEARQVEEMPLISAVFHNRLRLGYPLQADPTVQYALGNHRSRLLYADIEAVADHPYNTYTNPGLPPGPIGVPGEWALDAVLEPADVDYLYFVARPDGTHIFSRTLQEHNRARVRVRLEWDEMELRRREEETPQ